jgi:REP element-mobilizing transposase RayT
MAIRIHHEITDRTWFITFTCYDWLYLFEITQSYDLVYNWLKLIDDKYQIKTLAFVIMPNHIHLVLYLMDDKVKLNTIISNAKRFMAYEIVDRLKERHNNILDNLLQHVRQRKNRKGKSIKYLNHHLMQKRFTAWIFSIRN